MKRITRLISALIAAVLPLSALTVPAEAADEMLSLITTPLASRPGKTLEASPLGADLFSAVVEKIDRYGYYRYSTKIYRAEDEAIDDWRDSGTLILTDIEIEGYYGEGAIKVPGGISDIHDYSCVMMPMESTQGAYGMAAVRYDRKADKLKRYYTAEETNIGVAAWDGTVFEKVGNKLRIIKQGKVIKETGYAYVADCYFCSDFAAVEYNKEHGIKIIDTEGSEKVLAKKSDGICTVGADYVAYRKGDYICFYDGSSEKTYKTDLSGTFVEDKQLYSMNPHGFGNRLSGTTIIVGFTASTNGGYRFALFDIAKNKMLTEPCYGMVCSYDNGETYLAQKTDGTYSFLGSDGKIIADYEKAGVFCGLYAPVYKNGSIYLIDHDMKRVSKPIKVQGVTELQTLSDELYSYTTDDGVQLMTFTASRPGKPKLTVESAGSGKCRLSWSAVDGAERYVVEYSVNGGKTYLCAGGLKGSKTSCTIKLDSSNTAYIFRVQSVRTVQGRTFRSKWSNKVTLKTEEAAV